MAHPYYDVSADTYATQISYDGNNRQQYIGETLPKRQLQTGKGVWRIKRIFYDGATARILYIRWANASSKFNFVWDDRATYTY